jgi:hypothetical protein
VVPDVSPDALTSSAASTETGDPAATTDTAPLMSALLEYSNVTAVESKFGVTVADRCALDEVIDDTDIEEVVGRSMYA